MVTITDAKVQLGQLVKKAQAGQTIIISVHGQPAVELKPIPKKKKRQIGIADGEYTLPEDFNDPMSEEELALWYNSPIFPAENTVS